MFIGIHEVLDGVSHYFRDRISEEGALWILMMDGLFLIPLIFAVFFYPGPVLLAVGATLVLSLLLIEGVHIARTRHVGWRQH